MTPRPATPSVLPTHWTPEQALAVFECLQTLSEQLWILYGPRIQQAWRDQLVRGAPSPPADPTEPF